MTRNLKAFGLALVAVFAMSAVAASAASAAGTQATFEWGAETKYLTAESHPTDPSNTFSILGDTLSFTCNEIHGIAEVGVSDVTEVTAKEIHYSDTGITPETDKCTGPFNTKPKIEFNGCHYKFTAGTTVGPLANGTSEGTADIICPAGKEIVINAPGCVTKVPEQTGVGPITFHTTTTNGKETVTLEAEVNHVPSAEHNIGIKYSTSGILCGTHTNETDGSYTGKATIKGLKADKTTQTDVTVT